MTEPIHKLILLPTEHHGSATSKYLIRTKDYALYYSFNWSGFEISEFQLRLALFTSLGLLIPKN